MVKVIKELIATAAIAALGFLYTSRVARSAEMDWLDFGLKQLGEIIV